MMAATKPPPRLAPTPGGLTHQALCLANDRAQSAFDEIANRLLVLEAAQLFDNFDDHSNLDLGIEALADLFDRVREMKSALRAAASTDRIHEEVVVR